MTMIGVKLMKGQKKIKYNLNEYVIRQNEKSTQRLYQLHKGSCRIEKVGEDGVVTNLGKMSGSKEVFGEISFLEGERGNASASVIADDNNTIIFVIEGYYLNILFQYDNNLPGRFYHYIAQLLVTRLKNRQDMMHKVIDTPIPTKRKKIKRKITNRSKSSKSLSLLSMSEPKSRIMSDGEDDIEEINEKNEK